MCLSMVARGRTPRLPMVRDRSLDVRALHLRAAASLVSGSAELLPPQMLKYLHIESILLTSQVAISQITSSDNIITC